MPIYEYISSLLGKRGIRDHECTHVCMLILPVDVEGGRDHQRRHQVHEHTTTEPDRVNEHTTYVHNMLYVYEYVV